VTYPSSPDATIALPIPATSPGTSSAGATGRLVDHLTASLGTDPAWKEALSRLARGQAALHLAVLTEPFQSRLLDGTKTIESRFSRVRCAPHGVIAEGDIVAVKKSGGPITGAFQAGKVRSYQLSPGQVADLRDRYGAQIGADDEFWDQSADRPYATLVDVAHVRPVPALAFHKKDRRGWVRLTHR
jgi:hypothetical protein